jgi:uncharacterized protein YecE (DUF72 family)
MADAPIHIGTSGWHYRHWKGPFYPVNMASGAFLAYYAQSFNTVEINNTFYQLPQEKTFERWRQTAPPRFLFAVKASRYITHLKKLGDPEHSVPPLLARAALLGEALGPILFQLPPRWGPNLDRLRRFLQTLPFSYRYAFEFRDPSWLTVAIFQALAEHQAALCIYDFAGRRSPLEVTADFVYLRLHGPGGAYQGSYSEATLRQWADAIAVWSSQGQEVFCYFDNDEAGYAAKNALRLLQMVQRLVLENALNP